MRQIDKFKSDIAVGHLKCVAQLTQLPIETIIGFGICVDILEELLSQKNMIVKRKGKRFKFAVEFPN